MALTTTNSIRVKPIRRFKRQFECIIVNTEKRNHSKVFEGKLTWED
jgi:hypothetical protein